MDDGLGVVPLMTNADNATIAIAVSNWNLAAVIATLLPNFSGSEYSCI
jgi:hypothetical protein